MARNDIVLVDSIVSKFKAQLNKNRDDSEVFELFTFDQVLKDYDLSFEELETGWTDGSDDGGIDGFFIFVDDHLVTSLDLSFASKRNPKICVELFTVKRSDTFKQEPINSIYTSITELLDLTKSEKDFEYPFREEVLEQRRLLLNVFVSLADRRPQLSIGVHYCSRGDTSLLCENLTSRTSLIKSTILDFFSDAEVQADFIGASELLSMARKQQVYSLRLKFIESYISREGGNYIVLATLPNFFEFITDEDHKLRRYLFDSNIRDYLGPVQINQDIKSTLSNRKNATEEDFWWLNNGVTILATHANIVGKEITIENVQIVNGLQTTETIYEFYKNNGLFDDNRAVLVKILFAADESIRARIIKATNYQNTVELCSLRGLDTIQRDIEHYLFDNGWYYDRRKNYYKNLGRPSDRIISIPYLAAAVRAIALRDPARSQRQRSRSLRDDNFYNQVFNTKWDLNIYLACLEISNAVESIIQNKRKAIETPPITLVHYIAYVYTCDKLGKVDYLPEEVATLSGNPPTQSNVMAISKDLEIASSYQLTPGRKYKGITLSKSFIEHFILQRFNIEVPNANVQQEKPFSTSSLNVAKEPATLEGVLAAFNKIDNNDDPRIIVTGAYAVLRQAAELLSSNDGSPFGLKRTLINAVVEQGYDPEEAEKTIKTMFIINGKTRNGIEEISKRDAELFINALSKVLYYSGIKGEI